MEPEFLSTSGIRACDVLVDDWIEVAGVLHRVIDVGSVQLNMSEFDHMLFVLSRDDLVSSDKMTQLMIQRDVELTIKNQAR